MIKILFLSPNMEDLICIDFFHQLEQEIGKLADCKWAGVGHLLYKKRESINTTIKRLYGNDCPDWVVIYPTHTLDKTKWRKFKPSKRRKYKIGAITSDLHASTMLGVNYIGLAKYLSKFDGVFMMYKYLGGFKGFKNYYINILKSKICFMPACINPTIYKPTNEPKIYDAVFLGSVHRRIYPMRWSIYRDLQKLAKQKKWKVIVRKTPWGGQFRKRKISELAKVSPKFMVGERFVNLLGQSKIFLCSSSIYKYPLLRYVEGMACKTCVMGDIPYSATEMNFRPDWNFVPITIKNWKDKLSYWLSSSNDDEREEIAQRGYETALKYHTVEVRAKQVINFMKENL